MPKTEFAPAVSQRSIQIAAIRAPGLLDSAVWCGGAVDRRDTVDWRRPIADDSFRECRHGEVLFQLGIETLPIRNWGQVILTVIVTLLTGILSACSAAGPMITTVPNQEPEVFLGVVNGVWKYEQNENAERMRKWHSKTDEATIAGLATRYQVRVGIKRNGPFGDYSEVVVLPEGWSYSEVNVIDDGMTINVGDIVEIENRTGTNLEFLLRLVRKCNAAPVAGERPEWNIGCKAIHSYDKRGYGGEHYGPLTSF